MASVVSLSLLISQALFLVLSSSRYLREKSALQLGELRYALVDLLGREFAHGCVLLAEDVLADAAVTYVPERRERREDKVRSPGGGVEERGTRSSSNRGYCPPMPDRVLLTSC